MDDAIIFPFHRRAIFNQNLAGALGVCVLKSKRVSLTLLFTLAEKSAENDPFQCFSCTNAFQLYTYSYAQQNFVIHAHGKGKREREKEKESC